MWGFVRECPTTPLARPNVMEGWTSWTPGVEGRDLFAPKWPKGVPRGDVKHHLGGTTAWVLGVLVAFALLVLVLNWWVRRSA